MAGKLVIFDTTLRDGAQTPGIGINVGEKVRIAQQLERLGVDFMEVGFPASSNAEVEAAKEISRVVRNSGVAVLARATEHDIAQAWEAIKDAAMPRLQTFVSSSDIHIKHKLNMTREQVLDIAVKATKFACSLAPSVQFGFEDGSRTDRDFLCALCEAVIDAGASVVNIADTVGYALPEEFGALIGYVMRNTPNIHKAVVGVHCHDDLGLGVANTLAAVRAGARQVDVTINGIGERAGNTPLEEVVAGLYSKPKSFGLSTGIALEQIYPTSRLVSLITGVAVQPNKAIVGDNAFSHESGIHQDGLLKSHLTYEIFSPQTFGIKGSKFVLGKQSGKHGLSARLVDLGWNLSDGEIALIYKRFKEVADKKRMITDEDLEAIVADCLFQGDAKFRFVTLALREGTPGSASVAIELVMNGERARAIGSGASPIQAVFNAIGSLAKTHAEVVNFSVSALSNGIDAQGEAIVRLKCDDQIALGRGIDSDIIVACAKAHIDGLSRLEYMKEHPVLRTGEKWDVSAPPAGAAAIG